MGPMAAAIMELTGRGGVSGPQREPGAKSALCQKHGSRFRPLKRYPPVCRLRVWPRAVSGSPPSGAAGEARPAPPSFPSATLPTEETTFAVVAAGGTGGHVFPGIAVAQALLQEAELRGAGCQRWGHRGRSQGQDAAGQRSPQGAAVDSVVQFAGSRERLEWTAVPAAGFRLHALPAPRLLRRPRWRLALSLLTLPWRMAWACAAALVLLLRLRPRVVLGTGGYVALPACLAALLLRIPLVLQEQNAFPGRTNLLLSYLATAVCVGFPAAIDHFPASARSKCIVTGNPVRQDLLVSRGASTTLPGPATASGAGQPLSENVTTMHSSALQYFFPAKESPASDAGVGPMAQAHSAAPGLLGEQGGAQASAGQVLDMVPRERQMTPPLVLLVMGGSLGASPLNAALSVVASQLLEAHPQLHIIWQTGDKGFSLDGYALGPLPSCPGSGGAAALVSCLHSFQESKSFPSPLCHVLSACKRGRFIHRMDLAYAAADVAVCRAGAVTCSELLATGTPSVLIPSPYVADDHQRRNAEAVAGHGAAVILAERDLTAQNLLQILTPLIGNETTRANMQRNARAAARPNAAAEIARLVWDVGQRQSVPA